MGLTIYYGLKLPTRSGQRAAAMLEQLRQKALDLPFERVDKQVTHLPPKICSRGLEYYREPREGKRPSRARQRVFWLMLSCTGYGVRLPWGHKDDLGPSIDPTEAYVFQTWPGPGSEPAIFGLARYRSHIEVVYKPEDDDRFKSDRHDGYFHSREFDIEKWRRHVQRLENRQDQASGDEVPAITDHSKETMRRVPTRLGGAWRFRSFCKTQYASDPKCGGVDNFMRCHLSVIRMLEYAEELGFQVDVNDEGHFGPARYADDHEQARAEGREPTYIGHTASHDIKRLVEQCGDYNRLVAGLVGTMKDAMGGDAAGMVSPITSYPNFEHLEAEFRVEHGEKFDALMQSLGEMVKKAAADAKRAKKQHE